MGKTVEYQRYIIQSSPQYDPNWTKWRLRIFISVEDQQGIRSREFSSTVLYRTEQEADIHGITFGQRVIDGKLEGRSVADMNITDRRVTPRLRVQLQTMFSDSTQLKGIGIMHDVSMGGCRIESPVTVEPGMSLELRIFHAPDIGWPLKIEVTNVQWVSGQTFGLAFFWLKEDEQQRLEQLIHHLKSESPAG
jgi:PilZ domain